MAKNDQNEFPLPGNGSSKRESARHLPKYFRTDKNQKFLQSSLDQLLQPGVAEKVNSFVGRKTAKAYKSTDNYIEHTSKQREDYSLEPAAVIKDNLDNVLWYKDYNDYINQIKNLGGTNTNHSRNNKQEYYAWEPHIDWDKFANFREYYWLPTGPQTVIIAGDQKEINSTFSVNLQEASGTYSYIFTPDGATNNPNIKLYRGVTYRFEVNTPGLPFTIKTARTLDGSFYYNEGVSIQNIEQGIVEITLDSDAPDELFYVAQNDINVGGVFKISNISEATVIDVESEIVGKKYYTTRDGWEITNGIKVRFSGEVSPAKYRNTEWYVEGVGDKIQLISDIDVEVSFPVGIDLIAPYDNEEGFDRLPFGTATGYPRDKDYITINRASPDGNFWSRYNRWFHREVIELSARINGTEVDVDQSQRANRPIIEFAAGLKLYNFGTRNKEVVDLVDDFTKDAFSTIEGSLGYNIDGVQLTQGMRVLFLADEDPLVKGKIFEVNFINFKGSGTNGQISLVETSDSDPLSNENVLVVQGEMYSGNVWYYDGEQWNIAQEKTKVNQPPIFDVFDDAGFSFSNTSVYPATGFRGTQIFSYAVGNGSNDSVLGFPLQYRSIQNVGDIVYNFNFNLDSFEYQIDDETFNKKINSGYLRKYNKNNQYELVGAYVKAQELSSQEVVLQYVNDLTRTDFPINCYDNSSSLTDLKIIVTVNNKIVYEGIDYELIDTVEKYKSVKFIDSLNEDDTIVIKTKSDAEKNENGYYEVAHNLERNPNNENIEQFTLGEVTDHVSSIALNIPEFNGTFPGTSNLRDIANRSVYGNKFVKHSSPLNLSMYSLLDRDSNLIKSIKFARKEYSKFKRLFLETAENLGFEGPTKSHVDAIIKKITEDKINTMPFYFSDMLPIGASITTNITVEDIGSQFFSLTTPFTLNNLSTKAVTVYINNIQLIHGIDYTFNDEGYLIITASKQFGDVIQINEYDSTNGSFIPPTPTKLGLYPKYVPEVFYDDTYPETPKMIKGHDGSIIRAFDDYRDDLILELEKRIFNNIKINYDSTIFDINNFMPSAYRDTKFKRADVYNAMVSDFVDWLSLVDEDYSTNRYYTSSNSFTYNYSNMRGPDGEYLPGWWRGVYKHIYDTDRPHTNPWEMLGFSIKPSWWEEQYGTAPYTSSNLLLWEDLEKGIIRIPGQAFKINKKYARPGLTNIIPVDKNGNLISPSLANIAQRYSNNGITDSFVFGDNSPVETAWSNSSDFPFSIICSFAINNAPLLLATGFDRSRQVRNTLGHIVYAPTQDHIRLSDLVFPATAFDESQVLTSGIIDYINGYMASNVTKAYEDYKEKIRAIKNVLGFKLGGYTDKTKFKLILDSRTPQNEGNVFIPEENYDIFLNTSSPLDIIDYSGVIIEKSSQGFIIRGYNKEYPIFKYHRALPLGSDVEINVGGISESFIRWEPLRNYVKGSNVEYNNSYYKVTVSHVSGQQFETDNFVKLSKLPVNGGTNAILRDMFDRSEELLLPYGTILNTSQKVVDFLLGYESWLLSKGFRFEYYDNEEEVVSDWKNSAREFMFWSSQNWNEGAVIALSPVADEIAFDTEYSIVDDVFDNFYGYSLLKADGKKLTEQFTRINRKDPNSFRLRPKSTGDGVYAISLSLIQKEHVIIIDNKSVFGDVIYQPSTGYRQERIKILGYKTTDWDGSLNIPGFIYNEVKIFNWESWTDYLIGDIVKHKEFYYIADSKIAGKEFFDYSDWRRLDEKPESVLQSNFEYKTNQFADFYDLDTDNFDIEQQKLAQHLIGYQKRQYLENIINDDVSQYKFYQGFIADKGSKNSLDKLFNVLSSSDKESLEFYEEWGIKRGQYGASEGFDEVEFELDESKFKLNPQPFKLTNEDGEFTDLIYRIKDFEVYKKPLKYSSNLLPTKNDIEQFTRSPGYVHPEDVTRKFLNYEDILESNFNEYKENDYIWISNNNNDWNVYKYTKLDNTIISLVGNSERIVAGDPNLSQFVIVGNKPFNLAINDIIALDDIIVVDSTPTNQTPIAKQFTVPISGFFKVLKVSLTELIIESDITANDILKCQGQINHFVPVRVPSFVDANLIAQTDIEKGNLIWVDSSSDNSWKVLRNEDSYKMLQTIQGEDSGSELKFGRTIAADARNVVIAIASPDAESHGKVFVYTRGGNSQQYQFTQILDANTVVTDSNQKFGEGLAVTDDGKYIIAGSPNASNIKSNFKGEYDPTLNYENDEIVLYNDQLWQAVVDISGGKDALAFGSFGSIVEVLQKNNIIGGEYTFNTILTGNYPFTNIETDHILVRAPADQYAASSIGDKVFFNWSDITTANQEQLVYQPKDVFNGDVPLVNAEYLENGLFIDEKVDVVLFIDSVSNVPELESEIGVPLNNVRGYVSYLYQDEGQVTIYVKNSEGIWPESGSLFLETGEFVGQFQRVAPVESIDVSDDLGGYWRFPITNPQDDSRTVLTTTVGTTIDDEGRGLSVYNIIPAGKPNSNGAGGNIWDYNNTLQNIYGLNAQNSYIETLSYQDTAGAGGSQDPFISNLYVVRAMKDLTDRLSIGDQVHVEAINLPKYFDDSFIDIEPIGIRYSELNQTKPLYDLWDGYIDFELGASDRFGRPYEPKVGFYVRQVGSSNVTGLITFYQRFDTVARIFVKDVTGTWATGDDFTETATLELLGDPNDPDPVYQAPSRPLGIIYKTSLGQPDLGIGKLCVFENDRDFDPVPAVRSISGAEYYIYKDFDIFGRPTEPNVPSQINFDWREVYKITLDPNGASNNLNNYGMFTIFERQNINSFSLDNTYIVPDQIDGLRLGNKIKTAKRNNLYKAYIQAAGNSTESNPGRIYFINKGTDEEGLVYDWELSRDKRYKGKFSDGTTQPSRKDFYVGNVVYYEGFFYQARTNVAAGDLFNNLDWELLNSDNIRSIDYVGYIPNTLDYLPENFNFKGEWSSSVNYNVGEIVSFKGDNYYRALRNIPLGYQWPLDSSNTFPENYEEDWEEINFVPGGDSSLKVDQSKLIKFAEDFDVSVDGEVLIATAEYSDDAVLEGVVDLDGTLKAINIINPGKYYQTAPELMVIRRGEDSSAQGWLYEDLSGEQAKLEAVIDRNGSITEVKIIEGGFNYSEVDILVLDKSSYKKVVIYRYVNDNYQKSQEIVSTDNDINFAKSISVSKDGTLIAIGHPTASTDVFKSGLVKIYHQVNGVFTLKQTLNSPNKQLGEEFGASVDFDGNTLFAGAVNGDSDDFTTLDSYKENLIQVFQRNETPNYQAELQPIITNGVITSINILNKGLGYRKAPNVSVIDNEIVEYTNPTNSYNGTGSGVEFKITRNGTTYSFDILTVNTRGTGYKVGETIIISGSELEGITPTNDLILTISQVSVVGGIENVTIEGTGLIKDKGAVINLIVGPAGEITDYQILDGGKDYVSQSTSLNILPIPVYTNYISDTESEPVTPTTFDKGFTRFRNTIKDNGVVYIYDRVDDDLVYGQMIDYHTYFDRDNNALSYSFGKNILGKNNHIYVSMPEYDNQNGKQGLVVDYRKGDTAKIWNVQRSFEPSVDLEKIKQVMLYNKRTNTIVDYIDYIDPVQGKIAGVADQEIRYKTVFDPAFYNFASIQGANVDTTSYWGEAQVGSLWWDISNAKFINVYQGNTIYKTNNFNQLFDNGSIDVYEWVKSKIRPSQWDNLSGTIEGESKGITGTTLYGDSAYSTKRVYDAISQSFTTYFFYWVKNKTSIPDIESRNISAKTVADMIENPASQGIRFVSFLDSSSFALFNVLDFIENKDIVLNIQYWTSSNKYSNIHNEYQLLTENLPSSKPYFEIEQKWIDSLVGYDKQSRAVPDSTLSAKEKYGILNKPRQSMFVNRTEALKQVIERVNIVLKNNLIADEKDISKLLLSDVPPSIVSNLYDVSVDTEIDLEFIGISRAETAKLTPVIENGKITRVLITNPGRGYRTTPIYEILGQGTDAKFNFTINNLGQITDVEIINQGQNYNEKTEINVRPFSALVLNDSNINGNWALYQRTENANNWIRTSSQAYNVGLYWDYIDWYQTGYNEFTEIDFVIDRSYQLESLNDTIGDIVKILDIGGQGWLLLEKIDNQQTSNYTVNYKTIGRQNGTVKLKDTLYNFNTSRVGFDSQTFDTQFFDKQPTEEVRIILNALKEDILTADLEVEYNKLFFASLRYVLKEQNYVDWLFKTSFVKAQHNVGELKQLINFKNDALPSYEEYIKEVKPYKTKIREYVSNYDKIENVSQIISDFDNPPAFNPNNNKIQPSTARIIDNMLVGSLGRYNNYPDRLWFENNTYEITSIEISDPGSGYLSSPVIEIEGNATALASLGPGGKLSSVKIINPGTGYFTSPKVVANGSISDTGHPAVLTAKIGNSLSRNNAIEMKFDRVTGQYYLQNLDRTETFTATGVQTRFELKWPVDMKTSTIEIFINGELILNSKYNYENILTNDTGYQRQKGIITFIDAPSNNSLVEINYKVSINVLNAQDRIFWFYNPEDGQFGKELSQLMEGIDYGGVQVNSFNFSGPRGWDSDNWYDGLWDVYDDTFDELEFITDGSTLTFNLPNDRVLEKDVSYNVYLNGVRIDDPSWDGTTSADNLQNKNAILTTIIGDGVSNTFTIENENGFRTIVDRIENETIDVSRDGFIQTRTSNSLENPPGEIITLRKSTSDGSLKIPNESFDTALTGGDLAYTTALGVNAEEINIDGDGFVTPTTSKGPEEQVPGQVLDTLDITVYERPVGGSSFIETHIFRGDGTTKTFNLRQKPYSYESALVKINYSIIKNDNTQYSINYNNNTITFYVAPNINDTIVVTTLGVSGSNILDYEEFTGDGVTTEFLTNVKFSESIQAYITVNGVSKTFQLIESDSTYELEGNTVIQFGEAPKSGTTIQYALFDNFVQSFSQVSVDEIIADGSSLSYELASTPFNQQPIAYNIIVTVNDEVLNAGYSEIFIAEPGQVKYTFKKWQIPVGSVEGREIEVFLNGNKLEFLTEWTYEGAGSFNPNISPDAQPGSTITLQRGVAEAGDEIKIHVITSGDYRFGYYDENNTWIATDGQDGTPSVIHFDQPYNENDIIRIHQFSNHDSQGIERENYDVVERTEMTVGSEGYYDYRQLRNGLVKLRKEVESVDYVWVAVNKKWLIPGQDYILLENRKYIKLGFELFENDVVDLISFSTNRVNPKFGWRQFKDMLNRTHYKRLSKEDEYKLAEPLNWYDRTITLTGNIDNLPTPERNSKEPGILFINGERIEFFRREGNIVKQLRRGTLGTGVKDSYEIGTQVYNQSFDSTIPYKDKEERYTFVSGNYVDMSNTVETTGEVTIDSIKYDFNNNTVFPLGGQLATLTGTGFRRSVKVYTGETLVEAEIPVTAVEGNNRLRVVPPFYFQAGSWSETLTIGKPVKFGGNALGEIELNKTYYINSIITPVQNNNISGNELYITVSETLNGPDVTLTSDTGNMTLIYDTTTYISETEIKFITIAKPVGSYDLVIINEIETLPIIKPETSLVATKYLPYVQILIPFEPEAFTDVVKNPVEVGNWYKSPFEEGGIPEEYWQALDVELFANGRRLRKNPITVNDPLLGQDSPDGDYEIQAEFAVNRNEGAYIRLTSPPEADTTLIVVRRQGEIWNEPGVSLGKSNTEVSNFLRARTINLPR